MKYQLRSYANSASFIEDVLRSRGITEIEKYLHPSEELDPLLLDNMPQGAELLHTHILNNSPMAIVVDDDADGLLSSSLFFLFLKEAHPNYSNCSLIFHKAKFHGIETEKVLTNECKLLVVPDAGTNDITQQTELVQQGIDILILDHHQVIDGISLNGLPGVIVINNQVSNYPNKELCGTGVVYKFIEYYNKVYHCNVDVGKFLDLVSIALIGDVMGLNTLENRMYVDKGLRNLSNGFLKNLVRNTGTIITPTDISFTVIPPLNAVVRMGSIKDKQTIFSAIVEGVPSLIEEALRLCNNLAAKQRKERTRIVEMLRQRIEEEGGANNNQLIIGKYYEEDNVNDNLAGLTAMELATYYNRPALVLKYNKEKCRWEGSARNFGTLTSDLKSFLLDSQLVEYAVGHANAFGVGIPEKNLQLLIDYANTCTENSLETCWLVDWIGTSTNINQLPSIIAEIDRYKYLWGTKIEEPLLCIRNIMLTRSDIFIMGKDGSSVKFIKNNVTYVKFKDLNFIKAITQSPSILLTVIGKANINEWEGRTTSQIIIEDYELQLIKEEEF